MTAVLQPAPDDEGRVLGSGEADAPEAGSRRPPPRNLRERLLHAAMEALGELNPAMILNAIGAREIARRAGSSPASLFHHYGSMQGLADAVVARVFDPSTLEIDGILDKLIGLIGDQFPLDAGLAVHRADLDRMIADPEFTLRMGLWAFGGPSVTEAYRDYLRISDQRVIDGIMRVNAFWRREIRPPFDPLTYEAVFVALLNGSTVRARVHPELEMRDFFPRAASVLTTMLTRPIGDRHDLDTRLAEINYFPAARRQGGVDRARTPEEAQQRAAAASRILQAANALYRQYGYENTTVAQIAARADASTSLLHRIFGGREGVAAAVFSRQADEFLEPPQPAGPDPIDRLHAELVEIATYGAARHDHLRPYLMAALGGSEEIADDALHVRVRSAVAAARGGEPGRPLRADLDPAEAGDLLVQLVLGRVQTARGTDPIVLVDRVLALVGPGLFGPTA